MEGQRLKLAQNIADTNHQIDQIKQMVYLLKLTKGKQIKSHFGIDDQG